MDVDLETRLRKLMLFRVIMVTTLLFIATYVEAVSETLLAVNPLYFVIGAMYALTVVHAVALRFVPSRSGRMRFVSSSFPPGRSSRAHASNSRGRSSALK